MNIILLFSQNHNVEQDQQPTVVECVLFVLSTVHSIIFYYYDYCFFFLSFEANGSRGSPLMLHPSKNGWHVLHETVRRLRPVA